MIEKNNEAAGRIKFGPDKSSAFPIADLVRQAVLADRVVTSETPSERRERISVDYQPIPTPESLKHVSPVDTEQVQQ
jgi:hypothetical protein